MVPGDLTASFSPNVIRRMWPLKKCVYGQSFLLQRKGGIKEEGKGVTLRESGSVIDRSVHVLI